MESILGPQCGVSTLYPTNENLLHVKQEALINLAVRSGQLYKQQNIKLRKTDAYSQ